MNQDSQIVVAPAETLSTVDQLSTALAAAKSQQLYSYAPILPVMFSIRGKPFSLKNHFPFEPVYHARRPQRLTFICGRQVGKSAALAVLHILLAQVAAPLDVLFAAPLFEMIRRFSTNYVRKLIEDSPMRGLLVDASCERNVLQRTLRSGSILHFSFAQTDADRTRGIPVDAFSADEVQDMTSEVLAIIEETMGASDYSYTTSSGTPKSTNNTLAEIHGRSSMSEFVTKCTACNHWNIPAIEHDFDRMIGPWREDISDAAPGVICAKCERPINPRCHGRWVHAYADRAATHLGLHMPQIIMPYHYANPGKWSILLGKRQRNPYGTFLNEVGGIAYDVGVTLVTAGQLREASHLGPNGLELARKFSRRYTHRVVAIDWGGGGASGRSRTAIAACGIRADGVIEIPYGFKFIGLADHLDEVSRVAEIVKAFRATHIAHDANGGGDVRETLLLQAGFPADRIMGMSYCFTGNASPVVFRPPSGMQPRARYGVEKARSLAITCHQIKQKRVLFFDYDYINADEPGIIYDFMSLQEEHRSSMRGRETFFINTDAEKSDDFAQAVNLGCSALWHMTRWPDMAAQAKFKLTNAEIARLQGTASTRSMQALDDYDDDI